MNSSKTFVSGITLLETLISMGIFLLVGLSIWGFQKDYFQLSRFVQDNLSRENDLRTITKNFAKETRSASSGANGAYPVESALAETFIFYSDVDGDGVTEKVRYFISGTSLKKGTIRATGNPLAYISTNEIIQTLTDDVANPSSLFFYYDASYDGTTMPLAQPVDVSKIRVIKMTVTVDANGTEPPAPVTVSIQGSIRNLKGK